MRVPVGWWIGGGEKEKDKRSEFLGGQVRQLDRIFKLARIHKIGVFLAIHASPGMERHKALEGQPEWGVFPELVRLVLDTVDFLAHRLTLTSFG